jgi:hypothetical protein
LCLNSLAGIAALLEPYVFFANSAMRETTAPVLPLNRQPCQRSNKQQHFWTSPPKYPEKYPCVLRTCMLVLLSDLVAPAQFSKVSNSKRRQLCRIERLATDQSTTPL